MIELRQLRYFVRVAQLEHFGQAARELHVVQPALSRQIKQLEDEMGVELFERLPRGVKLTAAGQVLLDKASAILDDIDRMVSHTQRAAQGKTGFLKVGFADGATYSGHVPAAFGEFRKHNPRIDLELVPASSLQQAALVASEAIDIGFVYWLPANQIGIESCLINEEKVVLAAAKSNKKVTSREALNLRDLGDVPFVWFKRTAAPMYYDLILSRCNQAGLTLNVVQDAFTESTMLSLVSADIGVTFITEYARRRKPDNVILKEVQDLNATLRLSAMWSTSNRNPALKPFIETIERIANSGIDEENSDLDE
ncbi:MAG: LysR family transcriptional regulator [Candidatus Obscuribacterales bacterium]|nr:LysR family transcriptional regulator [Candidatus Obscuribacterales bacterium]